MAIIATQVLNPTTPMTYGRLKTAIASRLGRSNLTAIIPDFIVMAEPRMYFGFRDIEVEVKPLRLQSMLDTETTSLATLPPDFLAIDRLTVPGAYGPRALEYKSPQEFASLPTLAATPSYYTLQDGGIAVQGGQPASFTLSYYKKFAALISDADTNWLLTNHPAVYLYSALIEAYAHLKDDARIVTATRMYAAAVNGLTDSDQAARHSGSTLTIPSART